MSQEIAVASTTTDILTNPDKMQQLMNVAALMADAKVMTPKHLQGSQADCMAIAIQAAQWGMSPFSVAQKTHLVNGTLGYEAQLVNAVIGSSRAIKGRFKYEYEGEWPAGNDACIRCGAVLNGEEEITWGEWLFPKLITTKNSPLWKTNPKQQSAYLAVKYWARLYCPDVILGVYSADELEDSPRMKDVNEAEHIPAKTKSSTLDNIMSGKAETVEHTSNTTTVDNDTGEILDDQRQSAVDVYVDKQIQAYARQPDLETKKQIYEATQSRLENYPDKFEEFEKAALEQSNA